jgi:hypothetical protein
MKVKILLILCSFLLTFCSTKDEPLTVKEEHQQPMTSNSWALQNLTIDGTVKTSMYAGLTLRFTDTGFTATNGLPIWPESSSWSFTDETGNTVTF